MVSKMQPLLINRFACPTTGVHTQYVESFHNKIVGKTKEIKGLNDIRIIIMLYFTF